MFDRENSVIMSFFPFAGGKFLMNCLSLSRHACPQNPAAVDYLLGRPNDYDYRLDCVLGSLPDSNHMKQWREHEFGDHSLYGRDHVSWLKGQHTQPDRRVQLLMTSNLRFFITDHFMAQSRLGEVFPRAHCVKLVNSTGFQKLAVSLKTNDDFDIARINGNFCEAKYQVLQGPDWPSWLEFQQQGYDIDNIDNVSDPIRDEIKCFYPVHSHYRTSIFDVDGTYFAFDHFAPAVAALYQELGFDDFNHALLEKFYTKYMELHGVKR